MTPLPLGLALLAASTGPIGLLPMGETSNGLVIWHGHRIDPPYRLEVRYRAAGADTTWMGLAINGLSLEPLRTRRSRVAPGSASAGAFDPLRVSAASDSAFKRAARRSRAGEVGYGRILAEEFRRFPELVDSVVVRSPTRVEVHWRGLPRPDPIEIGRFESPPSPRSPEVRGLHVTQAKGNLSFLAGGGTIVVSRGHLLVPSGRAGEILAEIDSLRAGAKPATNRFHGAMLEEVLRPEPLDSLRSRMND